MWAQINYFKCKIYCKEENLQNLLGIDGIEFKVFNERVLTEK